MTSCRILYNESTPNLTLPAQNKCDPRRSPTPPFDIRLYATLCSCVQLYFGQLQYDSAHKLLQSGCPRSTKPHCEARTRPRVRPYNTAVQLNYIICTECTAIWNCSGRGTKERASGLDYSRRCYRGQRQQQRRRRRKVAAGVDEESVLLSSYGMRRLCSFYIDDIRYVP